MALNILKTKTKVLKAFSVYTTRDWVAKNKNPVVWHLLHLDGLKFNVDEAIRGKLDLAFLGGILR